ncbi:putative linoleate 9S-lipoxygenase 5 [Platanthera guangdongensis]|uniref:Linoleate 9S-lipoxygenase 5 n=1 Tax=Platanthera guangdongensis TaxID=2320717 RepID=A0ABR2M4Z1_9ASPA
MGCESGGCVGCRGYERAEAEDAERVEGERAAHERQADQGSVEYEKLRDEPEREFLKTIACHLQTIIGISLVEVLSTHASDEVSLGQRRIWHLDQADLEKPAVASFEGSETERAGGFLLIRDQVAAGASRKTRVDDDRDEEDTTARAQGRCEW